METSSSVNQAGGSANASEATAEILTAATQVSVDTLTNRHAISPYVYGGSYPQDAAHITDSGMTVVRWGGNATTNYNWQTHSSNSAADWWFSDYTYTEIGTADSTKFVSDTIAAGSNPLMTMVMVDWVSKASPANGNDNGQLYSFSVRKYGAQCTTRPDNSDAGNGVMANCQSNVTGNDPHDAYVPLLDTAASPCAGDCTGAVNRQDWTTALAAAFGSAQHFYDMDNESDIWGGTHRDIHPNAAGFEELRDVYIKQARNVKNWDPAAVRLGPVSCCWWFYWNGANSNDKAAHGNIDQLPWWLNEVAWRDQIDGTRSVDLFDIHAYPDGPDTSAYTQAQKQALTASIYRDYWDPTYVSLSGTINQVWATSTQPNRTIPFRIPRMRAMVNMMYPGTPLAITEWSAAFAGESDFSTALADADGYGILGRERVYLASRWGAPTPANPNYQALKLYRNYDGNHGTFGTTSVSATHNADPSLFSVYASLAPSGGALKMMVVNKDPANAVQVTFTLNNFSPGTVTSYTLSQASPGTITASSSQPWNATQTFQPYTATLLVVNGSLPSTPAAEWELNPDAVQVPANGSVTLAPQIVSGSGSAALATAQFDSGSTCAQNGGSMSITRAQLTSIPLARGAIAVSPGSSPGFCHFTVTGQDSAGVTQTQGGWIVAGNPAATLANGTSSASGAPGSQVTLSVTLTPGAAISSPVCSSAASCGPAYAAGASVLFTVDAGALSGGVYPAAPSLRQVAKAGANGVASVQLTLPATAGPVHVTAEGPYALGHPAIQFAETVQAPLQPPAAPVLTSPANGAAAVGIPVTLGWQASSGATSYNVYFGATSPPPLVTGTSATSYSPGALSLDTTYYWSVAAVNSAGSTRSDTWSFRTTSSPTGQAGLEFVPVAPCRVVDTRWSAGLFGGPTLTGGTARSFAIPQSACGTPATAQAYSLNVTVVPPGPLSFLTLWPTGLPQPGVSTLNSFQGAVVANAAIVPAGTGGAVSVYVTDATDVILDINGYFAASSGPGSYSFYPASPCRVADTRGPAGPFGAPSMGSDESRAFAVPSSTCGIPATAHAYSLNVTVVPQSYLGYLSAWPTGQAQPNVSTLNSWTGKVVANAAIVPAGTNESVSIFVTDPTNVILDINGYFGLAGGPGALTFYPVTPCRIADTRQPDGPFGGPIMASGTTRSFTIPASGCLVPATAAAYSLNVTVVPDGPLYYLTAWPAGSAQPGVSTLNSWDGTVVANAAIVPAGAGGAISVFANGQTQVILDINGYFAP